MKRLSKRKSRKNQQENKGPVFSRGANTTMTLARNVMGIPQSRRITLAWANSGSISQTEGIYAESASVLNNPYDPDPTLGGESAQGFAKNMAFYSKCFVIGAKWRCDFANLLTTSGLAPATAPNFVGCTVTTNSSSLSGYTNAVTNGLAQFRLLAQNPDTCMMQGSVDIGRYLNKPDVLDDEDLLCTSTSGPNQVVCLHTWAANTSANGTLLYGVLIEFDCIFTDPIPFT
jgi:hypothetical protein